MNLFTLYAKLSLDTDEYERKIKGASDSANTFASTFKAIIASDLVRKAADVMLQFASDSIEVASSLSEVQNVVDVTFGKDSGKIDRWAKTANRSFGLTELQSKKFSSTLGAMMKSSGLTGDAVTDMSIKLSELAADMASFYNLDYDQAFEKIRSGISGETEPLKQLGINMSVANLEAYAMSQGITKAFDTMSQAEQVQLRYNYLMQATADAQGDFARTSDGYANSVRTLQGNIETLKGKLGEIMLPLLEEAAGLGNKLLDKLVPEVTLYEEFSKIEQEYGEKIEEITKTDTDVRVYVGMLEKLESKTSLTAEEQEQWNEICRRLVQTLPSLSSIIDTQTGKVKGGTEAIRLHAAAWLTDAREQAKALALQGELNALAEAETKLYDKGVDVAYAQGMAEEAERKRATALHELAEAMNLPEDEVRAYVEKYGTAGMQEFYMLAGAYHNATDEAVKWRAEEKKQREEYDLLAQDVDYQTDRYYRMADSIMVTDEERKRGIQTAREENETIQNLTQLYGDFESAYASLEAQMKEAETYRAEMLANTRAQIEQTVSGFKGIGLGELAEEFDEDIGTMTAGLQDQAKYMEDYGANLKAAAEKGVDEGLLATLSDGSKESALYLQAIVSGTEGDIAKLNAAWLSVEEGKGTFTQALADQKLSVDTQYQGIIEKTNEMVANLDQKTTAYTNAANTASGIVEGLQSKQADVDAAIATLNSSLSKLGAWTIGNIPRITTGAGFSTSRNAHGLDYVPTNDYPAWLHKGEAVLTRNEAEGWRAIQSGPKGASGIDLDALAGVIVSAMGGVTLQMDRRTVGQVVAPVVSEEIAREARMRRNDL